MDKDWGWGRGGMVAVAVGRGLCADSLRGESSLAMLRGLDGDSEVAFFRAALLVFSAPLGCSPLRSLSQSPRLPEGWPVFAEQGAPRGRKQSLRSLSAWGTHDDGSRGRRQSL